MGLYYKNTNNQGVTMGRKKTLTKPSPDQSSFGIWLTSHLHANHVSVSDTSSGAGPSMGVIYSWIRGDTEPRIGSLIEVCEFISLQSDIPPLELLSDAIVQFPEAHNAQRRYYKRVKPKETYNPILQGLRLEPVDRVLQADIAEGSEVPRVCDGIEKGGDLG